MGFWGVGSDENDGTYDKLGVGIVGRANGVELTAKGRKEAKKDFPTLEKTPGVVIWFVKQGIAVPKNIMKKTICTLKKEDPDKDPIGWYEPNKRKTAIRREIKMLNNRIDTGKPKACKIKGIFG